MGVVVAVLYGLSIFSVLSLTALSNPSLERALRESADPDLHLVLYVAGARTPEITGRVNLPTLWRLVDPQKETSLEVRTQAPLETDPAAALLPDWSYTVQLPQGARVCCDGGDNACGDPAALLRVYEGSVTPILEHAFESTDTTQRLDFALSTFDLAENLDLDPSTLLLPGFPIKALRAPEGARSRSAGTMDSQVSCKLETDERVLATGALRLQIGRSPGGELNRVSSGTVEVQYRAPRQRTDVR